MKTCTWILGLTGVVVIAGTLVMAAPTQTATSKTLDTATIERLTGMKGQYKAEEGVFKVDAPRADLAVTVAGVKMIPPMGLTSYAAFMPAGDRVMVMGDTVLLEDQVNPVMDAALANGLEVTALHNHFFWDTPKVMFMHIGGMGNLETLASAVGKVFAKIKETSGFAGPRPVVTLDPQQTSLDPKQLDQVLGQHGDFAKGVYKATIGGTTRMAGHEVGTTMGVNTWAAFVGSDAQAAVDGDFVMRETELQTVLKTLRRAGINIVAIHNHVEGESPRIVFLHYWGVGPASELAKGIRAALDTQKVRTTRGGKPMSGKHS
ncbi:MAG TPA: DUF1259 domain-containing protein [Candidatus Methylomirabilis sp.]|nr:DUF1259 domain-containing protein [Candidatus Methylomirabilis sp.]